MRKFVALSWIGVVPCVVGLGLLVGPGASCADALTTYAECAAPDGNRCPDIYSSNVFIWQRVTVGDFDADLKFYALAPQWKKNFGMIEFDEADYTPKNRGNRADYNPAKANDGSLWTIDGNFTGFCRCISDVPFVGGKTNSITGHPMLLKDAPEEELPSEEEGFCDDPEEPCDGGDGGGGTGGGGAPVGYVETVPDDVSSYGGGPWRWVCQVTDWYANETVGGPLVYQDTTVDSCWLELA